MIFGGFSKLLEERKYSWAGGRASMSKLKTLNIIIIQNNFNKKETFAAFYFVF